jgi:DNA relaxase NicK
VQVWAGSPIYGDHVVLPGQVCGAEPGAVLELAKRLQTVSRLDVRADDYGRRMSPRGLVAMLSDRERAECVIGRTRFWRQVSGSAAIGEPAGEPTLYIGSCASARQLRVYDKRQESGGEIDAIRWELQMRDEAAAAARDALCAVGQAGTAGVVLGLLVGFIDFREPPTQREREAERRVRNYGTWRRLDWWDAIVGDPARVSISQARAAGEEERARKERWLHQVGATVLAVLDGMDPVRRGLWQMRALAQRARSPRLRRLAAGREP